MPRLLVCAALLGCGHLAGERPSSERDLAFRRMVDALAPCPPALDAEPLYRALSRSWEAGECGLLRGWLDLVPDPPPCGDQLAADLPAGGGNPGPCGVGWVLFSAPGTTTPDGERHGAPGARRTLGLINVLEPLVKDGFPQDCVLDADGNAAMPGIRASRLLEASDDRDLMAARRTSLPVEVAILGAVPGDDRDSRCDRFLDCGPEQRTLGARPFEVVRVCRFGSSAQPSR